MSTESIPRTSIELPPTYFGSQYETLTGELQHEASLADRLLIDGAHHESMTSMSIDPDFLVIAQDPVLYGQEQPITHHGTYFHPVTHEPLRVVSFAYDKSKDRGPGVRRVVAVTNVSQRQTHDWQPEMTYVSGALLGHILPDGTFVPNTEVRDDGTVGVNHYARRCILGERRPEEALSADPPA